MITAVKDLPSRSKTFDGVDLYLPNLIGLPVGTSRQTSLRLWTSTPHVQLFKSKKGSVGQKLQSINWSTPDATEQRSVVLKGIPIVLGDDSKDFFKTCFDTTRDEALSSVTVGVLFSAKTVLRRVRAQCNSSPSPLTLCLREVLSWKRSKTFHRPVIWPDICFAFRSPKMHGKYSEVRSNSDAWTGNQSSLTKLLTLRKALSQDSPQLSDRTWHLKKLHR
ncbi:uncharacterized protein [Pseudochaenichthys georgianus]|uniref:uncharacterized protein n=1 Tax=Pseudochaenichthys georgianus TaxID=52239 RepID=UPI00146B56D2|nr:uncharacterized protein LOC117465989 [Pseudochaenichthys georgianus]XP_033968099.1 uncharacterized protein LOC117468188 [Pseudochaenichthys georgianus]